MSKSASSSKRPTLRGPRFVVPIIAVLAPSVFVLSQTPTASIVSAATTQSTEENQGLDTSTGSIGVDAATFSEREIEILDATAEFYGADVYELESSDRLVISGTPDVLDIVANTGQSLSEGDAQFSTSPTVQAFSELSVGSQWHHGDLSTSTMWNQSASTSGITVAVIDTGVNATTELSGRLVPGWDFVDNDSDPSEVSAEPYEQCDSQGCWTVYPAYGHGTFIAHEIAAIQGNSEGGWGVCESCKIMPLRVLGPYGTGSMWNVVAGIDWAVANGADVINLSLGSYYGDAITLAAVNNAVASGVVVVAAAGNSGARFDLYPSYPAAYDSVLSVASHNQGRSRSGFSNYSRFVGGVDISAPGGSIRAASPDDDGLIWGMSGTSMATPVVAAVAAMVKTTFPAYSVEEINDRLRGTADSNSFTMYGYLNGVDALNTSLATPALPEIQEAESVIYFSSNYGDTADPAAITCDTGTSVTIPSGGLYSPTRANHTWSGEWSENYVAAEPLYEAGSSITCQPTTLYAAWDTVPTWSSNGGDPYNHYMQCSVGNQATAPTTEPTKDGFVFTGWNTQQDGSGYGITTGGTFDCAYYNFYAQWQAQATTTTSSTTTTTAPTTTTTSSTTTTVAPQTTTTTLPPGGDNSSSTSTTVVVTTTTIPPSTSTTSSSTTTTAPTTTTTSTTTTLPPPQLAPPPTVATTTTTTTTTTLPQAPRTPVRINPPVNQPIEQTLEETEEEVAQETELVENAKQKRIAAKKGKIWFTRHISALLNDVLTGGTLIEDIREAFGLEPNWRALANEAIRRVEPMRENANFLWFDLLILTSARW